MCLAGLLAAELLDFLVDLLDELFKLVHWAFRSFRGCFFFRLGGGWWEEALRLLHVCLRLVEMLIYFLPDELLLLAEETDLLLALKGDHLAPHSQEEVAFHLGWRGDFNVRLLLRLGWHEGSP